MVAIINLYIADGCPEDGTVRVSFHQLLLAAGFQASAHSYREVRGCLRRLQSTSYQIVQGWWSQGRQRCTDATFNYLWKVTATRESEYDGFRLICYIEFIRHVQFHDTADDFWSIFKRSTCAVERRRSQLLALLAEGKSNQETLAIARYSYQGADKIIDAYHERGLASLADQRHGNRGAPTLLTDAELLLLARTVRADSTAGEVWSGLQVQSWVSEQLQKQVHLSRCYEFLDVIGFSRQLPRPQHVEADPTLQEEFKKKTSQTLSAQWRRVLKGLDGE